MANKCDCGLGDGNHLHRKWCASLKCTCGRHDDDINHDIGCPVKVPPGGLRYFPPGEIPKREGVKFITALPGDEPCVGMLMFKDTMYVATSKGVYRMVDGNLEPVQFVVKDAGGE